MKQLKFICAQPDDVYYVWQTHLWIESLKALGHSDKAIVLVHTPSYREYNGKWEYLKEIYPEVEFCFYKDNGNVSKHFGIYIPILRPYCLGRYWEEHPEMKDCAVFYSDCDVLFTERFNIDKYINDDVCYLSDTVGYIGAVYFDSKIKDVLPERIEEYKNIDVLDSACRIVGINRQLAELNNLSSGGAQYLLKGIDAEFWKRVFSHTLEIRKYLMSVNRQYFSSEEKGFQSWCSDMWAVLWNLWWYDKKTECPSEMSFAWASDPIEKVEALGIFHNAGVIGEQQKGIPMFWKGKYHTGTNPFEDPQLKIVFENEESKKYGTWYYVSKMIELNKNFNL